MASDFLTSEWGCLLHGTSEVRIFFEADKGIDIFEARVKAEGLTATGLFLFDNAPTHLKCAPDALTAKKIPKGPSKEWGQSNRMRPGTLPDGTVQQLYWPDNHPTMPGWFKGMEQIIKERNLWRDGLRAQCPGFKCKEGKTDCCCR
ncbi:hypothetical protein GGX14DRAFT_592621 [Mycena pura]|uniref:Uncharacterized protein n=1 Tax=Mycena pura TaxID=153505 RepID=A0AAD6YJP4_9AGAR|nr:hypothetical protein GGX14DRAFT_592621 [Mycena pura]